MAQKHGPWHIESSDVNIYPDFTNAVQKQRGSFIPVKQALRQLDNKYAMFFRAKLRVIYKDKSHYFQRVPYGWAWIETQGLRPQQGEGKKNDGDWQATRGNQHRKSPPVKSPSKQQMRQEQEKTVREITQSTDILSNNRWRALTSEYESSTRADTEMEVEEIGETPPRVTPRSADDL